jgi:mono/diheme cytochrome c family protein
MHVVNTQSAAPETGTAASPRRGGSCLPWIILLLVLAGGGAATAYIAGTFLLRQETVLEPEAAGADLAKRWLMIEPEYVDWQMPARFADATHIARGKDLLNTECITCHGQDGRKPGGMGVAMFPPAVDLSRDRTQSKTDGQIFWLIWHGVNYTGMPAWGVEKGGPHDQEEIWSMVAFIRSLKK